MRLNKLLLVLFLFATAVLAEDAPSNSDTNAGVHTETSKTLSSDGDAYWDFYGKGYRAPRGHVVIQRTPPEEQLDNKGKYRHREDLRPKRTKERPQRAQNVRPNPNAPRRVLFTPPGYERVQVEKRAVRALDRPEKRGEISEGQLQKDLTDLKRAVQKGSLVLLKKMLAKMRTDVDWPNQIDEAGLSLLQYATIVEAPIELVEYLRELSAK